MCYYWDLLVEDKVVVLLFFEEEGGMLICIDVVVRGFDIFNIIYVI